MATVEPTTSASTSTHLLTAGLIVLTVLAIVTWTSRGGQTELPVELPDVVAPGAVTPPDVPEVLAAPSESTERAASPLSLVSLVLPDATVTENGDGRVLVQFEGLRPGVTAE